MKRFLMMLVLAIVIAAGGLATLDSDDAMTLDESIIINPVDDVIEQLNPLGYIPGQESGPDIDDIMGDVIS